MRDILDGKFDVEFTVSKATMIDRTRQLTEHIIRIIWAHNVLALVNAKMSSVEIELLYQVIASNFALKS